MKTLFQRISLSNRNKIVAPASLPDGRFEPLPYVRYWPLADIGECNAPVRFRGNSGHDARLRSAFAVAIGCKADMAFCAAHVRF